MGGPKKIGPWPIGPGGGPNGPNGGLKNGSGGGNGGLNLGLGPGGGMGGKLSSAKATGFEGFGTSWWILICKSLRILFFFFFVFFGFSLHFGCFHFRVGFALTNGIYGIMKKPFSEHSCKQNRHWTHVNRKTETQIEAE
jgi:hypothetical protein